jgi:cytochrome c553
VQGDPERGATIAYTCTGCHGIPFYQNIYPTYTVPKLGGQNEEYLVAALKAYRAGQRKHATMQAQASTLSDQDIRDVSAYFVRFSEQANPEDDS